MTPGERAAWFLANACPDHHVRGGPAHVVARHTAARILSRSPEIARHSLFTAVVCGEIEEVERRLRERPEAASEKGGPKGSAGSQEPSMILDRWQADHPRWEPLLYLCFARLPLPPSRENAVAVARALLDRGADPNAFFMAGDSRYTPLVGAIGEGEEDRPPHPRRDELVRLLLDGGAEPYDLQVVYNIHFQGDVLWFLKMIHARAVAMGRSADWEDPRWSMLDMGGYGSGARWHLEIAIKMNDLDLAEWVLSHGASPLAEPASDPRFPKGTLHDEAMRRGLGDMAALLARFGATPAPPRTPEPIDRFASACLRLDRHEAQRLLDDHPELVRSPGPGRLAAERDRADVAELLLDLGMPLDLDDSDAGGRRLLHVAALHDAPAVASLLIARGAEVDFREASYGATPLGFAVYAQKPRMIELLSRSSKDLWNLVFTGNVERAREVLTAEPGLALLVHPDGETPLMRLPDDEERAIAIVDLLLGHGADPTLRNEKGRTAADCAAVRALDRAAERLRAAVRR